MRTLTVDEKHAGIRIGNYIKEAFPLLPFGALQKALRKRDVKVDGVRVGQDYRVSPGDRLEIYIMDELLYGAGEKGSIKFERSFTVVYEDDNLLIVNKKQGVPVHPDREQSTDTLVDLVRDYLNAAGGSVNKRRDHAFQPSLCHRLDRNTGGLVIIARNKETLDIIIEKMESGEIRKYYQCFVKGRMEKKSAHIKAYLSKDEKKSKVYISDLKTPGSALIATAYRVLEYRQNIDASLLEVELVTGRTHQIRAHLAHIGHPVLGDGKYGSNAVNRPLRLKRQVLWAYRLKFDFKDAGMLDYLKGREFTVKPEFPPDISAK